MSTAAPKLCGFTFSALLQVQKWMQIFGVDDEPTPENIDAVFRRFWPQTVAADAAELEKLRGFYTEIVKELGHDLVVKAYRERGELLIEEAERRKSAEGAARVFREDAERNAERAEKAEVLLADEGRRIWCDILVRVAGAELCSDPKAPARWADQALADYQKRYPTRA